MLNYIIQTALRNRLLIVCFSLAVIVVGTVIARSLPIDVLPDLTRPRVSLLTECNGLAPEEVEQRVTFPLESAIIGAPGVSAVRSTSDIGLSVIQVDFDWDAEIYQSRQIIQERVATVRDRLPRDVELHMGPISSLLGQIMMLGMWSEDGTTGPLELRTNADWVVRQRLLTIPGVSQVITMGGGRKQFQVLVDQHRLHQYEVSLSDVEEALRQSNLNVTGGYVDRQDNELLIRGIGLVRTAEDIRKIVVKHTAERPILVQQVAEVSEAAQQKRGDSSVNGKDSVVLTIQKQPGADTRKVTQLVHESLAELRASLPADVRIESTYEQREFIDYSVHNVIEALRDGAILVVIVLFLFLMNFRTTFITLTAIPLSVLVTALVFRWFDMSINVMTLGGIAVALGELVDDAIVDVENIFRRLKQNRLAEKPRPVLTVIFEASMEVRNAIIISTMLVIIVFAPLFALSGMEGRLFTPLGVAYIVSILASTVVSLTVTPVLSYYLLPKAKSTTKSDGVFLRGLKRLATPLIQFSMKPTGTTIGISVVVLSFLVSVVFAVYMGKDFLQKFDEGSAQVNLFAPPGTSLQASRELSRIADSKFQQLLQTEENPKGPIRWFTCRTGRAEQDEHAMGVHTSEYVMSLNPDCGLSRLEIEEQLMECVEDIPGVQTEVEQPIFHLISHMLSGVTAQIAIKLYGDDLDTLRREAREIQLAISDVPGIKPPVVEQQNITPQFRVDLDSDHLAYYGINAQFVQDFVETAMHGRVVSKVFDGQRSFDLMLRLAEPYRNDLANFHRVPLELPSGKRIPLDSVARVYESGGPNTIKRDDGRRRIVVRVNTTDRDLGGVMSDIRSRIDSEVKLPEGYFVTYGGQFEAQQTASKRILLLSCVALVAVFVVLYSAYPDTSLVLQILFALPAAFVGGVLALKLSGQTMSTAAMVGFISLGGIAARNGLLLMSTYLDGVRENGFSEATILKGSLERLAPVLMTALTTGIGLVPLVLSGHLPGKEILFPVATVILGGLVTSTLCEYLVRPGLFRNFGERAAVRLALPNADDEFGDSAKSFTGPYG